MKIENENKQIVFKSILIIIGLLLTYPIIVHYMQSIRELPFLINESFHSFLQVFFTGPLLILLGIFCYKNEIVRMKLIGIVFFFIGFLWILGIIIEVLTTYP